MSPPDSKRSSSLPTLTWESIVERGSHDVGDAEAPAEEPAVQPTVQTSGSGEVGPVSLSLHLGDVSPVPPPPPAAPTPPVPMTQPAAPMAQPAAPMMRPLATEPVEEFHLTFGSLSLDQHAAELESHTETAVETEIETAVETEIETETESPLPLIREATPVEPYISDEVPVQAVPSALVTTMVTAIDPAATPLIPGSQPGPIVLPPAWQPDQSSARAAVAVSPLAVEMPQRRPATKRRGHAGLKLIITLVVLGAIVGGAIVVGRPYLFPDDWAANAQPYANAVEAVTGGGVR